MLNAAIGFQALRLTHPKHMLQGAVTTVRHAQAIHGQRPTSLLAEVRAASAPYFVCGTDHLVHNAYTAHTATHLQRLMHNQEPELRVVFTLRLREPQHERNTCPQYILRQRGLPTTVGTRILNHLQLLLPHQKHVIQTIHRCKEAGPIAILHTDTSRGPTGEATILDQVGATLHLMRVTPNQMRVLQRAGTHHVSFLQHPGWPNESVPENHPGTVATAAGNPQPADGEIRDAYNLFWSTHKQPLQRSP